MDDVNTILKKNLPLHIIIENEVRKTPFGNITFNIILKNGLAQLETLEIVKTRRKKYDVEKQT